MRDTTRRPLALLTSMMLAATLGLSACGNNGGGSSTASEETSTQETASASAEGDAANGAESQEPFGNPWITSIVQGNLPAEQPSAKDDLYTHVNYDYLSAHQEGEGGTYMMEGSGELKDSTLAAIKDESRNDHELQQMRILFEQASDADALAKIGFGEVQPYIDMIDKVSSIDEMNELLGSRDFPFSPFLQAFVGVADTRNVNIVAIVPNLIFADAILSGGQYYQDGENEKEAETNEMMLSTAGTSNLMDAKLIGFDINDQETMQPLVDFEKSYAKYCDYATKWLSVDYGESAKDVSRSSFTLDELCALCPNFPMREVLAKLGKDQSKLYSAYSHEWLGALSDAWTSENLENIKLAAKCKVLMETAPFRDPSVKNEIMSEMNAAMSDAMGEAAADAPTAGAQTTDPSSFAFEACDTLDTFSQVIAKLYVEDTLGQQAKDRLNTMTEELINEYKDLIADTAWVGAESDERVTEKLDNMALNILEPDNGYFDYSGLELVPTEEGGTLFSNYLLLKQYRYDREAELIGKPATASVVWYEIKPTLENAFYDPISNSINIFPGYVTSSVYRADMNDTQLLAGIGFVTGHEISHGFDYQGSQQDAYGLPNPIFSDDDVKVFLAKCGQLADRYSAIEYSSGKFVNGQNVVAEAAADLCGLQVSQALAESKGLDREEFYTHFAQLWAEVQDSVTFAMTATDVHPASNLRVNVNAQMFDQFYETFDVAEGDAMYLVPDKRVIFWGTQA